MRSGLPAARSGLPAALLPLAVALFACAAPPPPPPADPRVFLSPGLPLIADAPNVSSENGLLRVVLHISNGTDRDVPVLVTTEWVDGASRPLRSVMSAPRRVTVPRFRDVTVDSLALAANAAGFRVSVEPDPTNP
jgi:hypothetical protein